LVAISDPDRRGHSGQRIAATRLRNSITMSSLHAGIFQLMRYLVSFTTIEIKVFCD
jgi:hypothetical protein